MAGSYHFGLHREAQRASLRSNPPTSIDSHLVSLLWMVMVFAEKVVTLRSVLYACMAIATYKKKPAHVVGTALACINAADVFSAGPNVATAICLWASICVVCEFVMRLSEPRGHNYRAAATLVHVVDAATSAIIPLCKDALPR